MPKKSGSKRWQKPAKSHPRVGGPRVTGITDPREQAVVRLLEGVKQLHILMKRIADAEDAVDGHHSRRTTTASPSVARRVRPARRSRTAQSASPAIGVAAGSARRRQHTVSTEEAVLSLQHAPPQAPVEYELGGRLNS